MMHARKGRRASWASLGLLVAALGLAGCNDIDRLADEDDHHHHEDAGVGRLVFGKADGAASQAVIYDLGEARVIDALALGYAPTAVYASPGHRYAAVLQANDGFVNFVDGGVWLHGDHGHADAPSLLALTLSGSKPAHYRAHEDQAALFYDGEGAAPARFELFTDASLSLGSIVASHTLPAAVHGIAEPRDGFVLALDYSAAEAAEGATRSHVGLFELHGDHFHAEGRFETPCVNLHGGSSNEEYSAFGCTDGVLLIHQHGDHFHDTKIETPQRITQVAGHHGVEFFAAFAGDGTLYRVDPVAETATAYDWNGPDENVGRRQHLFDAHGERLLILDVTGTLHVLGVHGDHFHRDGSVQVFDGDQTAARIATSAAGDLAFVTDPAGKAIVVIDLEHVEEHGRIELDFAPVGVAWVGIPGEGASDEHGHDHAHDHVH